VYKLRKAELELSVNDTLLVQEAQKRQVTTNALLDAEVKPKAVTEEQARAFFEQNKERISGDFAQTRDSIIRYLEQLEVRIAERAFVEKLRATASIQLLLVAPESPVFPSRQPTNRRQVVSLRLQSSPSRTGSSRATLPHSAQRPRTGRIP